MTATSASALQHSTDLTDVIMSMYQAFPTWDATSSDRFFSQQGLVAIGTEPEEWVTDYQTFGQLLTAQAEAVPGTVVASNIQAFTEGTVGWVADHPILRLADGTEIPMRMTTVFHREDDSWKIVQTHWSIGERNEETFGEEATQAIDQQVAGETATS